jgi:hypothetical protein
MPPLSIVAIDWSGRLSGAREAIWIAQVDASGQLTTLENGRDPAETVDYLIDLAQRAPRPVVGLDFAFGFPAWWSRQRGWCDGRDVWQAMATQGAQLLEQCEPPFWGRPGQPRKHLSDEGLRKTDTAIGIGPQPKSVFQIGGAGAVGTGSVRGMAQLHRLAAAGFAVWPFDKDDGTRPVAIELYPRRLTGSVNKSAWRARHAYLLANHADQPKAMLERAAGSEDAFDAAVSAIVMGRHRDHLVTLPIVDDPTLRLEGQIWTPA